MRMHIKRHILTDKLLYAVLILLLGAAASMPASAASIDHFKCYKSKDLRSPRFVSTVIALDDQFQSETDVEVKKPFLLCNPTSKNGEGVANPADHLVCYKVKKKKKLAVPVQVEVVDQLGTSKLEIKKSFLVCVPSSKTVVPSQSGGEFLALSYNVAGLPEVLSGSHPETNMPIIGPLLNNYDLVLVQESWQTPDPNPVAPLRVYHEILVAASTQPFRSIPVPLPLGSDPERPSALVSDGLNRFSRFRFDDVIRQRWVNCHESSADCLSLKGFSVARTTLPGGASIDVYNLHNEAGNDPQDEVIRDENITQLVAFIDSFSTGQALIVGGDFNLHSDTEPDSTQFQRLLNKAGLTDVCTPLNCSEPGRIDKFLFRSSVAVTLTPTSWHFETDIFVDGLGEPLSDHDPLAVRFQWSSNPAVE